MKILVLTTIYPRNDGSKNTAATKVIHYFAQQWQTLGHEVYVIHTPSCYFELIHQLPQKVKDLIKAHTGNEIMDLSITKCCNYIYEGIPVYRRPLVKWKPHGTPSDRQIYKMVEDIYKILKGENFEPELIIGHWSCPTVQLLAELKKYFSSKCSVVFHEQYYLSALQGKINKSLKEIDVIGCRSRALSQIFKQELHLQKEPFVCASGVPEKYLKQFALNTNKFDRQLNRFIFVGELLARKHCDTVIQALASTEVSDWHLDVVGAGNMQASLENLAEKLGVEDCVTFHGRVSRDRVMELVQQAQCFIMPSKGEAFGLVYLEAMAASCITIGSRNEGIDGIILDSQNGMLVDAGSVKDLERALCILQEMSVEDRKKIARNGYITAQDYSDRATAERYINDILTW